MVIETIHLNISHHQLIQSNSCSIGDTGVFVENLINQYGCDSIVTLDIDLLPSHFIFQEESTCIQADTGIFVSHLQNQFGCDSIITHLVTYAAADTTRLTNYVCNASDVKVEESFLIGSDGCDSLVISSYVFEPPVININILSNHNGYPVSCHDSLNGHIIAEITGHEPFSFLWSDQSTGSTIVDAGAGMYSLTVTDVNGCTSIAQSLIESPPEIALGFNISDPSCFDQQQGMITAITTGGVPPFEYSLDGIHFQIDPTFPGLSSGSYQIIASDANGCSTTEVIWINQVLPVEVSLGNIKS